MKTLRNLLIITLVIASTACTKEKKPEVPGVMKATAEMTVADFNRIQYYKFLIKVDRDKNVTGNNIVTIDENTIKGRGLIQVEESLYMGEVQTGNNVISIEYQPLTNEDKNKPFSFDVTINAGNTQPVTVKIALEKPLIIDKNLIFVGLDQYKQIEFDGDKTGATYFTDSDAITIDDKGRLKGIKPGKATIGVKRDGVVATVAVHIADYRPVTDFVVNVNGKDYHAATDTIFARDGDILRIKMGNLMLPMNANSRNIMRFGTYGGTFYYLHGEYVVASTLKKVDDSLPFEQFYTDTVYELKWVPDKGEACEISFTVKMFPELPKNYYNFTTEQERARLACNAEGKDGNYYYIDIPVIEIK